MAERKRVFSSQILDNDDFIDLPTEAQMLYIRLNMAADDRGICDSPRTVMRACGASNDSMKLLIAKKFVLSPNCRPSVIVIKHWWINNSMKKDRFKETKYTDVLNELFYDKNKSYSQNPSDGHISCINAGKPIWPPDIPELVSNAAAALPPSGTKAEPTCIQNGNSMYPQYNTIQNNTIQANIIHTNTKEKGVQGGEETTPTENAPLQKQGAGIDALSNDGMTRNDRIEYLKKHIAWFREHNIPTDIWKIRAEEAGIKPEEVGL